MRIFNCFCIFILLGLKLLPAGEELPPPPPVSVPGVEGIGDDPPVAVPGIGEEPVGVVSGEKKSESVVSDKTGLPEVLVKFSSGTVTRDEFKAALKGMVAIDPKTFGLGESFLRHKMIVMEAVRLKVRMSSKGELGARIALEADRAAKQGMPLEQQFKTAGITDGDFRRMMREAMLFEDIARKQNLLRHDAQVDAELVDKTYSALLKKYSPQFFGFKNDSRVATIGGINFTADEVVDYLCEWGGDKQLEQILEDLIRDKLVIGEAIRLGVKVEGLKPEDVFKKMTEPYLSDSRLRDYYKKIWNDLEAIHTRYILFAFEDAKGNIRTSKSATLAEKVRAKSLANAILQQIKEGKVSFEDAAKGYSYCKSASNGGDLGYLMDSHDFRLNPPPKAYSMDYVRTQGGTLNPLAQPPMPEVLSTVRELKNGEVSTPVETDRGYVLVKRIELKRPDNFEAIKDFLKRRRFIGMRTKMLKSLRAKGVDYVWYPALRERD